MNTEGGSANKATLGGGSRQGRAIGWLSRIASYVITFLLMFGLWIVLSGKFEPILLVLGLVASGLVTALSARLFFPEPNIGRFFSSGIKLMLYVPWLLYQIFLANLHVLYLVFHPRMMELIDPHIVFFRTKLTKDFSIVTMANSITLTPGTITVTADLDGRFRVHAIDRQSSEALPGEMQNKVSSVFGES
jgi:multicomponent Na+:H+ antiporter subunit E